MRAILPASRRLGRRNSSTADKTLIFALETQRQLATPCTHLALDLLFCFAEQWWRRHFAGPRGQHEPPTTFAGGRNLFLHNKAKNASPRGPINGLP